MVLTKVTLGSAAAWASVHPWRFIADKMASLKCKRRNPCGTESRGSSVAGFSAGAKLSIAAEKPNTCEHAYDRDPAKGVARDICFFDVPLAVLG